MTRLSWETVVANVRYPKAAGDARAPYEFGMQIVFYGKSVIGGLFTDVRKESHVISPSIYKMLLKDLREMGYETFLYERPGGRFSEVDLTQFDGDSSSSLL